jgi:hypothetical protein
MTAQHPTSEHNREGALPTETWSQHEHIAPPVQSQAQQLLNKAGSPELARHALDEAAREQARSPSFIDSLADQWGYASRHELLGASISVASQGELWWLTPVSEKGWVAWTERDQRMSDILPSIKRARTFVTSR